MEWYRRVMFKKPTPSPALRASSSTSPATISAGSTSAPTRRSTATAASTYPSSTTTFLVRIWPYFEASIIPAIQKCSIFAVESSVLAYFTTHSGRAGASVRSRESDDRGSEWDRFELLADLLCRMLKSSTQNFFGWGYILFFRHENQLNIRYLYEGDVWSVKVHCAPGTPIFSDLKKILS